MHRIPVISQEELFLDLNQEALVYGKVELLDPISNNLIDVWTFTDSEYTVATNPVRLNVEGRVQNTIFSDRLTYVRVYKYLGLDENRNEMFEFVRDYLVGFDENSETRDYVVGIEALKDLDPSVNSSVNVIGYYESDDCEMRTYVWVPSSVLEADGGYVINSDVDSSGKWILDFDGPYIPSTYYGVYEGSVSNINALLSYPEVIHGKKTARGIYFTPGHYATTNYLLTTKNILISSNTQFDTGIECNRIDVKGKPSTWIADIQVNDSGCPVHSCWYKSARAFWGCNSKYKYCDGRNWTDDQLVANISNFRTHFYGADAVLTTDTNGNILAFNQCVFEGNGFLDKDSSCSFSNMEFTDRYYNNFTITPANITFSQLSGQGVTLVAKHFKNPSNMVLVGLKTGSKVIDMQECVLTGTVDFTGYTEVYNVKVPTMVIGENVVESVVLKNVTVTTSLQFNGQNLSMFESNVKLSSFPNISSINVHDNCIISNGWTLTQGTVNCNDSEWAMSTGPDVVASFTNSVITGEVKSKNMAVYNCRVKGYLKTYPLYVTDHYEFKVIVENSVLDNDMEFVDDGQYDIFWNVAIMNNTFNGSNGIKCKYWSDVNTSHRVIAPYASSGTVHNVRYEGNRGNCPNDRYYGQVDCALASYWYNFNAQWMRGRTNPSTPYKVMWPMNGHKNRYFLVENKEGAAMPVLTRNEDLGFGMLMGDDTNVASYGLVAMSEALADSVDSSFNSKAQTEGLTPDNTNDYFYRMVTVSDSNYDPSNIYYFW